MRGPCAATIGETAKNRKHCCGTPTDQIETRLAKSPNGLVGGTLTKTPVKVSKAEIPSARWERQEKGEILKAYKPPLDLPHLQNRVQFEDGKVEQETDQT